MNTKKRTDQAPNPQSRFKHSRESLRLNLITCLFVAVLILMAVTPLGFIQLPALKLTLVHIPVILGSMLLGWKRGALLGLVFALSSLVVNTLTPSLLSFAFSPFVPVYGQERGSLAALAVCFIPRLLVGTVPGLLFARLRRSDTRRESGLRGLAWESLIAAVGSLVNTLPTLGLMALFFSPAFGALKGITASQALTAIAALCVTNGVPEALAAAVLVPALLYPLRRQLVKTKGA